MWVKKSIKPTLDACRIFAHLGGVDFFGEIIFAVYIKMTKHKKSTAIRCAKNPQGFKVGLLDVFSALNCKNVIFPLYFSFLGLKMGL